MFTERKVFGAVEQRRGRRMPFAAVVAAGGLLLAGCTTVEKGDTSATSSAPAETVTPSATRTVKPPEFLFDDLGGGSSVIQVYPGAGTSEADKVHNGTYMAGQPAMAECKTEGRTVHSDTSVGEADRTSNEWVRIQGDPDRYATTVYIQDPERLLAALPDC